jgi:Protein of unknown function (DUF2786)
MQVSDNVLTRIRKALALGLHAGGSPAEKEHAMRRATKLMQKHGLSQVGAHTVSKTPSLKKGIALASELKSCQNAPKHAGKGRLLHLLQCCTRDIRVQLCEQLWGASWCIMYETLRCEVVHSHSNHQCTLL